MNFSFLSPKQQKICPFCFDSFSMKDAPFRCSSPASVCAPERDDLLFRKWNDVRPIGRVLPHGRFSSREAECQTCKQKTSRRICPNCHMNLPPSMNEFDNYIFAVIGAKDAGKSHYIAVLIEQFKNVIGPSMNILLEPANENTIRRYNEDFYDRIYKDKRVIESTASARTGMGAAVRIPLIYSLIFHGKGASGKVKIFKGVTLVFFDTAGEDLKDSDVMATVNKYIYRSDGIIVLLDPLQLNYIRDQLPGVPMPDQSTETSEILSRTTSLICQGRKLSATQTIDIPLAIALSKFDAVMPLIDHGFQLRSEPNHNRAFDVADFKAVNDEVQSLLTTWNGEFLIQQVSTRFKIFGFFGLTALGCNPHGDSRIPKVFPRRVADPFLWLLYQHNLIPGAK